MKKYHSSSEKRTGEIAQALCQHIGPGSVVAFRGGLGMGKTAFVRGAIKAYGNNSFVSSPTFALVHDYGGSPHIYHFDMYRVTGMDDLYSTGFFEYLNKDSILFIEWSENIESALPENTMYVDISPGPGPDKRVITISGGGF